jgi:hypothetical protein
MNNADHGPFEDARWLQTAREAVQSYIALSSPSDCPLFAELAPHIARDKGEAESVWNEGALNDVWASLPDAVQRKSEKIGLRIWLHYVKAMRAYLPKWHSRLLISWYLCLQQGLLKDGPQQLAEKVAAGSRKIAEDIVAPIWTLKLVVCYACCALVSVWCVRHVHVNLGLQLILRASVFLPHV